MSNFKNKVSIILTMALLFAFILPFNANAACPATNLTIHKITGDTARPSTNGELTGTETPPRSDCEHFIYLLESNGGSISDDARNSRKLYNS